MEGAGDGIPWRLVYQEKGCIVTLGNDSHRYDGHNGVCHSKHNEELYSSN